MHAFETVVLNAAGEHGVGHGHVVVTVTIEIAKRDGDGRLPGRDAERLERKWVAGLGGRELRRGDQGQNRFKNGE